jgi:glycosyltransferase involved in cell wall biosynthesis
MPTARRSVTLFYPMYNEKKSVEPTTRKALQVMSSSADDFEILIIDDGSTDGSEQIADQLAAQDSHIRVIHHQGNKGYGQALRTGWASASKDIVVYTDCDEPVDLWKIPEALALMDSYDLVIGYRLNRWEGWRRFIYSKGYNALVRLLFGVRARDINFSFKLIRRELLQKLRLGAGSVFIDGELLAEAARYHPKIHEIPVQYLPRKHGASHFDSIRAATYTLEEIWAYWQRRRRESKGAVGALGAVNPSAASTGYESQAKRP